jgi:hypothetical protein
MTRRAKRVTKRPLWIVWEFARARHLDPVDARGMTGWDHGGSALAPADDATWFHWLRALCG